MSSGETGACQLTRRRADPIAFAPSRRQSIRSADEFRDGAGFVELVGPCPCPLTVADEHLDQLLPTHTKEIFQIVVTVVVWGQGAKCWCIEIQERK